MKFLKTNKNKMVFKKDIKKEYRKFISSSLNLAPQKSKFGIVYTLYSDRFNSIEIGFAENDKILDDKIKLKRITSKKMTSDKEKSWLRLKLREYKVKNSDITELDKRMDIIPVSIALAQAAKESGWGTSRFALEGNAIFGQWTWTGQGIEPLFKGKNEGHKILRFPILFVPIVVIPPRCIKAAPSPSRQTTFLDGFAFAIPNAI